MTALKDPSVSDTPQDSAVKSVLVVDDSRLQRRIVTASLSRWGYKVIEAASGVEALDVCAQTMPDLVLSDWMMPEMNGLEFCRAFRQMPHDAYGYFILLTSKSEKDDIALGLDAGADDFLTKPVNPAELRARISAGERIVRMQRELSEKNRLIKQTLDEIQTLYDGLEADLIAAKKLQQSLIPERYRDLGPAEVSLLLHSSGHVGGDLVGMFPVNDTHMGLYSIDVSGHGVGSALMTARLAGYLSSTSPEQNVALVQNPDGTFAPRDPSDTVAYLNDMILGEIETDLYFTMILADVCLEDGTVRMVQAGHPNPAIQRSDGSVEIFGVGGLPVGLIEGATYEQFEVQMRPGDRLCLRSDGVDECADADGVLLEDDGFGAIMQDLRQTRGMAFMDSLLWKLARFSGRDEFDDDVSGVLLEFKPVTMHV